MDVPVKKRRKRKRPVGRPKKRVRKWKKIAPRHVGTRDFVVLLKQCMEERNEIRAIPVQVHPLIVCKAIMMAYLEGMIKIATEKSIAVGLTKGNAGAIQVIQFASENDAEWDKVNGLTDCDAILTHKYPHVTVTFDQRFKAAALQRIKGGQRYLTDKYERR